jgi:putative NADH-flavin reductase
MKQKIQIAIIGGTGKAGKYLVEQLIYQDFHIKMLVRNPEKFQIKSPFIEVIYGDVKDYETVFTLVEGCHAVMSTLGLGQPPSETSIFSKSTINVIRSMHECNVKRYIVITGLNVDTPFDQKSLQTQMATDWMYANYPKSTTDKQLEYSILSESKIDWTLVRLPLIELTSTRRELKVSLEDCVGDKISATDLAHFLIEQLTDNTFIKKSPFIANI